MHTNTYMHRMVLRACQHTLGGTQNLPSLASGLYLRVIVLGSQTARGNDEQVALREVAGGRCPG